MAWIRKGQVAVASDLTTGALVRKNGSITQTAVDERIGAVASGIIAGNPTVVAAAAAAVEAKLAAANVPYELVYGGQREGSLSVIRGAVTYSTTGGPFGVGSVRPTSSSTASAAVLTSAVSEPSGEVTITAWIKLNSIPTGQNRVACALGGTRIYIGAQAGTGNVIFSAADTAFITSIPIADGAWHFVEGAFSRTSGVTRPVALHVDGAAVTVPVGQSSQAWDSTFSVLGFNGALSQFDWPGEVGVVEVFTGQRTSFGVPTSANTGGGRTLALAWFRGPVVQLGSVGYPPRPNARGGMVGYTGPVEPTTWIDRDRWVEEWV